MVLNKVSERSKNKQFRFLFKCLIVLTILFFGWAGKTALDTRLPNEGNAPFIYSNQCRDDLRQTFCEAIAQAKQSIHLLIFSLTDSAVIHALRDAAQRGIEVHVVSDGMENKDLPKRLGTTIKHTKRFASGLMHQKILVIDKHQLWIGSANMTSESLRMHGNLILAFDSPSLAKVITENMLDRRSRAPPAPLLQHEYFIGGQPLEFWQLPSDDGALNRLLSLIHNAQQTIKIAMFTWTHPQITNAVINAQRRGVQVEVVIDATSGRGASQHAFEKMRNEGLQVSLSLGPELLHHKFAWVDNTILVNGSANWTRAAFTQNDDCFVILHQLTPDQQETLSKLWKIIRLETQKD
jgi:phosphatidylserine/phosphatidylglycerophosphate/cardiolipin synthase-like enzyme